MVGVPITERMLYHHSPSPFSILIGLTPHRMAPVVSVLLRALSSRLPLSLSRRENYC